MCVLIESHVLYENKLEIDKILEKNRNKLPDDLMSQLSTFLHLCSKSDDIIGCMKNSSKLFGIEHPIRFDPLLKMNLSLTHFFGLNQSDANVLNICNLTDTLKRSEDVYVSSI